MPGGAILGAFIGKVVLQEKLKQKDKKCQDHEEDAEGAGQEADSGRSPTTATVLFLGHLTDRAHRGNGRSLQGFRFGLILLLGLGEGKAVQIPDQLLSALVALKEVGLHGL